MYRIFELQCHPPLSGGAPPPGGESPCNFDFIMSVRESIHHNPKGKRLLVVRQLSADRALRLRP